MFLVLSNFELQAQGVSKFNEETKTTEQITMDYFQKYLSLNFDELAKLMHQDVSFHDPTANMLMGNELAKSKDSVLAYFKTNYTIYDTHFPITQSFFSGTVGVIQTNLQWKFKGRQGNIFQFEMPLVVVLTVKDGKVIEHRDYGDYRIFIAQMEKQRKK